MERSQYETVSTTAQGGSPAPHYQQPQQHRTLLVASAFFLVGALLSWFVQERGGNYLLCNTSSTNVLDTQRPHVKTFPSASVASDQEPCSQLGRDALELYGGNAADGAVVVGLCLGVVNPASSGLGGGAFATISIDNNETVVLDCREEAPELATQDMFQSASSEYGGLAIPVFAELHCWVELHAKFGLLPWKDVVMLVVDFAEPSGTVVGEYLAQEIDSLAKLCVRKPDNFRCQTASKGLSHLITKNGDWRTPLKAGDTLRNPALMATLREIANHGLSAIYDGKRADQIAKSISNHGGIVSLADMQRYRAKWRQPLMADVGDFQIFSVPPPSSGGAAVIGVLRFLLASTSLASFPETLSQHRLVEGWKHIFAIRMSLSDPDYNTATVQEAVADMVNSTYIEDYLLRGYDENTVQHLSVYGGPKWAQLNDGDLQSSESAIDAHEGDRRRFLSKFGYLNDGGTSHFCIVDSFGNAVSMTTSINTNFGSNVLDPYTGIIFSNTMDDFSSPGTADHYGLKPAESNYVVPTKRPLSSMSPTLVYYKGKFILVVGGSGGPKIITAVSQVIMRHLLLGQPLGEAVSHPRIHNQLVYHGADVSVADNVKLNTDLTLNVSETTRNALLHRNQNLLDVDYTGTVQAISVDMETKQMVAACDPRKGGIPAGY